MLGTAAALLMGIAPPRDSLAEQLAGILSLIGKPTLAETRVSVVIEIGRKPTIAGGNRQG
jgi:hypothetical protein